MLTEKQSRVTGVSDFCVNRKQAHDTYEFEVLISVQKNKALALVKIMPDSKIVSAKEFFIDEAPVNIVCLGQFALIRCSTHFKLGVKKISEIIYCSIQLSQIRKTHYPFSFRGSKTLNGSSVNQVKILILFFFGSRSQIKRLYHKYITIADIILSYKFKKTRKYQINV